MTVEAIKLPRKSSRVVRGVVASWRRLTGDGADESRRTLIACSGGGDSCGLVLALAAGASRAADRFVVAHVVHDLRPRAEALADRESAADLAAGLGLPFVSAEVRVRAEGGNAEGAARRLRYAALVELARENGCRFIATAHHAGDQLESILMALVRGAGPAGLRGAAGARRMGGVRIIRPALGATRDELRAVCREAAWEWREDATNADTARLRAALRHRVVPLLEALRPGAARRAARSAELMADAAGVVTARALGLIPREGTGAGTPQSAALSWPRNELRVERPVVLGALVRISALRLRGRLSHDRLGLKTIEPLIRAIRSRGTDPKRFVFRGLEAEVTAHTVMLRCTGG